MTNPRNTPAAAAILAVLCAAAPFGCGKKDDRAGQQAAPAPAPPPRPLVTIDPSRLHAKVQFPEDRLPSSQEAADAVAKLASAVASGDAAALSSMLSPRDRAVLGFLEESGEWLRQVEVTKAVRVCVLREVSPGAFEVGLGIQDNFGAFLTAWEAVSDSGRGWVFSTMPIEPRLAALARELDGAELTLMQASGRQKTAMNLRPTEQTSGIGPGGGSESSPPPQEDEGPLRRDRF